MSTEPNTPSTSTEGITAMSTESVISAISTEAITVTCIDATVISTDATTVTFTDSITAMSTDAFVEMSTEVVTLSNEANTRTMSMEAITVMSTEPITPATSTEAITAMSTGPIISAMPTEAFTVTSTDTITVESIDAIAATSTDAISTMSTERINPTMSTDTSTSDAPMKKNTKRLCDLTESERYAENKRLCELQNFPPPMSPKAMKKIAWTFNKTVEHDLRPGYSFRTLQELSSVPRMFNDPFCWPGPLERNDEYEYHWHLADSIVQEVRLKSVISSCYVVRWRGFEDEYNTVEPLAHVKHTAIYKLFTNPTLHTACGISGSILRRSSRNTIQKVPVQLPMNVPLTRYELAMGKLRTKLLIEEEAGRYCPIIGFCSYEDVIVAVKDQHKFLFTEFLPNVKEYGSAVHVDNHYLGIFCGTLSNAAKFKEVAAWQATRPSSIKDYIHRGLSASKNVMLPENPHFVSFFAPKKFDTAEKKDKDQLKFHMCVFTVRSLGNEKDAIYFDPSPFNRNVPNKIECIRAPKFKTFTRQFGVPSEKNDCLFQCMEYIIGLATGHVTFEPDLSKPARKIDKHMKERSAKRRKT